MKTRALAIGAGLALLMVAQTWVLWAREWRALPYGRPLFYALRLIPVALGFCGWLAGARTVRSRDAMIAVALIGGLAGLGDAAAYSLHLAQDQADRAHEAQIG